jgi:tetratricopeptide (TPR) repeat protein
VTSALPSAGGFFVFLGAGASVAAGIPTAGGIIRELARASLGAPAECNPESWVRSQPYFDANEPYASVLDAALPSQRERVAYFERLIAGRVPTRGHRAIASLVNAGVCRGIVTTNFDRLAEYAVLSECHHAPRVVATDSRTEPRSTRRAQIFKLHGDYLYQNIRNLGHELWMMRQSTRRKLAYVAGSGPLVVAGYSGSDDSVMDAMEAAVDGNDAFVGGIFWLMLHGVPLNSRAEAVVAASGGAIIEIESTDAFFVDLQSRVSGRDSPSFPALGDAPHLQRVPDTDLQAWVEARLLPADAVEFLNLLAREPELRHLCQTAAGLDFVLASFEEEDTLPSAVGHLVDRYVDSLSGAFTQGAGAEAPAAERRVLQLLALGLARRTADSIVVDDPLLAAYRMALERGADLAGAGSLAASLADDGAYRALRMYVGLIDSATPVIGSAARLAYGRPALHGRNRPWPEAFHRVVRLAGAARHVHHSLIEHLATLVTLEFDAELWPPYEAVASLASLGNAACDYLIDCLLDSHQETFAREDAALALGQIGSRRVVARLRERGAATGPRDRVHVVYALGQTGNPQAAEVIALLAPGIAAEDQGVIDRAMSQVAPGATPPRAGASSRGPSLRPALVPQEIVRHWCPDLASASSFAGPFRKLYLEVGRSALNAFEEVRYPEDLQVLANAAITARQREQFWEAEVLLAEALSRYPMISHIYHDLGLVYSAQGRSHAARRYYAVGMSLEPAHATFYNDYGVTMMNLGDLDAARFLLVRAISIDWNDHRPWFNLAGLAMGAWGADRSKPVVRLSDGGRITTFTRATGRANLRDATICLRRVVELMPDHQVACESLGFLLELTGSQAPPPPTDEELFAALHLGEGELGGPVNSAGWPEAAVLAFQRSSELRYAGDVAGALDALDPAGETMPENPDILRTRGMLFHAMGNESAAAAEFEAALRIEPWDRHTLMNLSESCRAVGDSSGAVRAAQHAVRADPTAPGAWICLARAFLAGGKVGDARDTLLTAIQLSPPFSWTLLHAFDIIDECGLADWLFW